MQIVPADPKDNNMTGVFVFSLTYYYTHAHAARDAIHHVHI